jgi:spore maturation protein SpmA
MGGGGSGEMLNRIFVVAVLGAILVAAARGEMQALTDGIFQDAVEAVEIVIRLIGVMAFFLGLMKVAERGGLLRAIARAIGPLMRRLFPGVPAEHPAMSAMILNIGANMLGLGNAATPFGIRAMEELDTLNGRKGTATNAMVLFLAINTAGLTLLPTSVVALRASVGSRDAFGIIAPTWIASACATFVAIAAAILLSRLRAYRATEPPPATVIAPRPDAAPETPPIAVENDLPPAESNPARLAAAVLFVVAFAVLLARHLWSATTERSTLETVREVLSFWCLPAIVALLILFGWVRGVRVFDALVEGAKEGFHVAVRIIPYVVAILVAIGMLRASGAIGILVRTLEPLTALIGMPSEAMPMALLRPLSASGAYGLTAEVMTEHGPDSKIGFLVSTIQGSTETTFYVLALYYGAIGVKATRHTIPACLAADVAGILAAVAIVNLLFG